MRLNGLSDLSPTEVRVEHWLASVPPEDRLITERGRIHTFDYPNYNVDPRPQVLVLGQWTNPSTNNTLLGGLNLNYMTQAETERVRKALPLLLRPKDLKSRYWVGRKILTDIFTQFYRTYNSAHIQSITPSEFESGFDKKVKDRDQATAGLDATRARKAAEKILAIKHAKKKAEEPKPEPAPVKIPVTPAPKAPAPEAPKIEKPKKPEKPAPEPKEISDKAGLDKGKPSAAEIISKLPPETKKKLAAKLHDISDPGKREKEATPPLPKPEPPKALEIPDIPDKPEPPEKKDAQADVLSKPPAGAPKPPADKPVFKKRPKPAAESLIRHPRLGYIWSSPETYRQWHKPTTFLTTPELSEGVTHKPLLAIYDTITDETLMDRVDDHVAIIQEAGLHYGRVIRLLPVTRPSGEKVVVPLCDGLPAWLVEDYMRRIPEIVIDHLLNS